MASSEVRTPNPQVARVDNRLPISGAPPPARLSGQNRKEGKTQQDPWQIAQKTVLAEQQLGLNSIIHLSGSPDIVWTRLRGLRFER